MRPQLPPPLYAALKTLKPELGVIDCEYTGSRFICPDHCEAEADWDVVCLVKELPELGEPYCGANDPYFESIKFPLDAGLLNIIATKDQAFYLRFCTATRVARWLGLTSREDRVKLFQAILYNANPGPAKRQMDELPQA